MGLTAAYDLQQQAIRMLKNTELDIEVIWQNYLDAFVDRAEFDALVEKYR